MQHPQAVVFLAFGFGFFPGRLFRLSVFDGILVDLFHRSVAGDLQIRVEDILITALTVGIDYLHILQIGMQTTVYAVKNIVHIGIVILKHAGSLYNIKNFVKFRHFEYVHDRILHVADLKCSAFGCRRLLRDQKRP